MVTWSIIDQCFALHPLPNEFPLRRTCLNRPHIAYAPIYTQKDNKSVLKNTIRTTQIRTCSGFSPRQDIKYHNSGRTTHTKKHVVSLTQLVCYAVKNLPACVVDVSVNICHCQSPLNKGWPWRHSIYNFFTFAKFLSIT